MCCVFVCASPPLFPHPHVQVLDVEPAVVAATPANVESEGNESGVLVLGSNLSSEDPTQDAGDKWGEEEEEEEEEEDGSWGGTTGSEDPDGGEEADTDVTPGVESDAMMGDAPDAVVAASCSDPLQGGREEADEEEEDEDEDRTWAEFFTAPDTGRLLFHFPGSLLCVGPVGAIC